MKQTASRDECNGEREQRDGERKRGNRVLACSNAPDKYGRNIKHSADNQVLKYYGKWP